eukprot:scaffold19848_cov131-Isochrysis_galbana.AAC.1
MAVGGADKSVQMQAADLAEHMSLTCPASAVRGSTVVIVVAVHVRCHGACPRLRACVARCRAGAWGAAFPLVFDSGVLTYTHCSTHASRMPQATSMQLYVQTQEWGYFATLACPGAGSSTRGRDRLLRDELFIP